MHQVRPTPNANVIDSSYTGFHVNVFKATLRISDATESSRNGFESVIRPHISWNLAYVHGEELTQLRESSRPHVYICGNSIAGETEQYLERLPAARTHNDDYCADNIEHCNIMTAADQDRITLALFADHKHYAFPLSGEEARVHENDVVKRVMDEVIPGLSQQWRVSKDEVHALGTGPSLRTCMWQHVALESPARFLRLLGKTDRPIILGAPVIDYDVLGIKKIDGFDEL